MKGLGALIVFGLLIGALVLGIARWEECLRVHPFWYCASAP